MALVVGTNSWVTVAEADAYLAEKFGADAWTSLANSIKEQCLITAYRWINSLSQYLISSVTDPLKYAQIELAWYIYNYYDSHQEREALFAQGVEDFTLSKWKEKLKGVRLPKNVEDLLEDFDVGLGGYFPAMSRELNGN
jgi:hypothetical protein